MNLEKLFSGISVVIDDEIGNEEANITRIVEQVTARGIPTLKFESLPSDKEVSNFNSLSFVLLDWRLGADGPDAEDVEAGVKVPGTLAGYNDEQNMAFLRLLREACYCPVFIFTNETAEDIVERLVAQGLYIQGQPNHIFVQSKSAVEGKDKLFEVIDCWLKKNPSVYVLKEWEREYSNAKNQLFSDFQKLSVVWPKVLWRTIGKDEGNKSLELGELISRNLETRMTPFEFEGELLESEEEHIDGAELRRVLEGERFLTNVTKDSKTGDVYFEEGKTNEGEKRQKYWLNIRAQCDLLRSSNPELYLLPGKVIPDSSDKLTFHEGQFIEKPNHAIVAFLHGGNIIQFSFDLTIKKRNGFEGTDGVQKVGCLLPPYISKIQQRFALYLHRHGLPRIPDEAYPLGQTDPR